MYAPSRSSDVMIIATGLEEASDVGGGLLRGIAAVSYHVAAQHQQSVREVGGAAGQCLRC